jgi:LPS export ABC transporter protein LptC
MKKIFTRHWPLLAIGIIGLVVGTYLLRAPEEQEPIQASTPVEKEEGIKLQDIHYTQDDPDDSVKWVLDAEEVRFSTDRSFFSFKQFKLKLKPENKPTVDLEGQRGDYDKNTGIINLLGDLQGSTDNGYTIWAEKLLYRHKEGILTTDGPVTIKGPFFSVDGKGLYFNLDKEFLRMLSGVTTTINEKILTS